jgi:hypothetical protein
MSPWITTGRATIEQKMSGLPVKAGMAPGTLAARRLAAGS